MHDKSTYIARNILEMTVIQHGTAKHPAVMREPDIRTVSNDTVILLLQTMH
jgi:hypothetical protein